MNVRLDLSKPRYDQSTFEGRAKHFFITTNPLNVFRSTAALDEAKFIVDSYKAGTEDKSLTEDDIWKAKEVYDSAYHPETGEKIILPGRMSFQVYGNCTITGFMMTFYKSTPATIFWQFMNQSFNSLANYCNRNASAPVSDEQLMKAYFAACGGSVATALGFNKLIASTPALSAGPVGRFVPLIAVAAANMINIPLMRQQESVHGITLTTPDGQTAGNSTAAAKEALYQVIPSRIGMAIPSMGIPPMVMARLDKTATYIKNPWLRAPTTILITGLALTFSTPVCCAFFPQDATIPLERVEPTLRAELEVKFPGVKTFTYNKGL